MASAEPAGLAGPGLRYRLLETIRQFAADQVAQASRDEAPGRDESVLAAAHCAHYLAAAETAAAHLTGPDLARWVARLDADHANLRRAARYAAGDPDQTAHVLRFGAALRRYWLARYRYEEAFALLMPVLERPAARADPALFGAALVTATYAACPVDIATARRLGEQAVTLARQLGTERLLIESLTVLGHVYCFAGELERGLPPVQEAVQRARQLGDDVLLGESLTMRMTFLTSPADAKPLFNEAIACTQRSGDELYAYYLNSYAGGQALYAGDIRAARAHLGQAAQFIRAIRDEDLNLLYLTGWVLRRDNDQDGARSSFRAILRIDRRIGNRAGIAAASLALACLAADAGDWHQAAMLHGAAQAILPTGIQWDELEDRSRRDSLDQIRCQLGQEQFERAYAAGSALSSDQALDLASGTALVPGGAHHGPFGINMGSSGCGPVCIK